MPVSTFGEIENIIDQRGGQNDDIYGVSSGKQSGRKMADIYKRVREMDERAALQENDMETQISKLVSAKPMYTNPKRFGSQMRPKHLKSLSLCTPDPSVHIKQAGRFSALNAYSEDKTEDL